MTAGPQSTPPEEPSAEVKARAQRHLIILYIVMILMAAAPFIFLLVKRMLT